MYTYINSDLPHKVSAFVLVKIYAWSTFFFSFSAKLFWNLNLCFNIFFFVLFFFCLLYLYKLHRTAFSGVYFPFWFSFFLLLLDDIDLFMFFLFLCCLALIFNSPRTLSVCCWCCRGCCWVLSILHLSV